MRYKISELSFVPFLLSLSVVLFDLEQYLLAIVAAFMGIIFLINREYYVWASSTSIALVITFYVLHMVPEDSDSLSVILVFLSASFVGTKSCLYVSD